MYPETTEVNIDDLRQIRDAIDAALTGNVEMSSEGLVLALELLQTYLYQDDEEENGNEAQVQAASADEGSDEEDSVESVA